MTILIPLNYSLPKIISTGSKQARRIFVIFVTVIMKISFSQILLTGVFGFGILLTGCDKEFEVDEIADPKPIVYCTLNPSDSLHYLRLSKSFLTESNLYTNPPDSGLLLYNDPDLTVTLECWHNGNLRTAELMSPCDIPQNTDSGFFPRPSFMLFSSGMDLNTDDEYRLSILIPSEGKSCSAVTQIVKAFEVVDPMPYSIVKTDLCPGNQYITHFISAEGAEAYQVSVRFWYYEITGTNTVLKSVDHITPTLFLPSEQGKEIYQPITGNAFFKALSTQIEVNPVVKRRAAYVDFTFVASSPDFAHYMQVFDLGLGTDQAGSFFTNIKGGIGFFASSQTVNITGKLLSGPTIDSLAMCSVTKNLNFADHEGVYHTE